MTAAATAQASGLPACGFVLTVTVSCLANGASGQLPAVGVPLALSPERRAVTADVIGTQGTVS